MIKRPLFAITMLIFLLILHFTFAVAQDVPSQALRVNGAAIASDIVQKWANSFTQSRPNIRMVVTGSSAGKGFSSLFDNHADIAIASRLISKSEQKTAEEKGLKLANSPVGYAGVAVYTSNRNPINELTLEQLRKIFTGQVENWSQLGGPDAPIRCLTRRMPESGAVVFFWETVLEQEPFAKSMILTENWSTILKTCATAQDIPIGIGPVPLGANTSGAKILAIKKDDRTPGVLPSESTLKDQSYPIVLQFHFYWNSMTTDKRVIEFVEYCEKMGLGRN
jgi:phosphate transport system substrate-binding protein